MLDKKVNEVIRRLSGMIEKRFGCGFEYINKDLVEEEGSRFQSVVMRNTKAPMIIKGDDMLVPVSNKGNFLGLVRIVNGASLEPEDMSKIKDVVNMILGSILIHMDRLQKIEKFRKLLDNGEMPANVIPMWSHAKKHADKDNIRLRPPVLIEDKSSKAILKLALDLHINSGRQSFLNLNELNHSAFDSVSKLLKLSSSTIYIPDVSKLSKEFQIALTKYIDQFGCSNFGPWIILGTNTDPSELAKTGVLDESFFKALMPAWLKLNSTEKSDKRLSEIVNFYKFQSKGDSSDDHPIM